MKLDLQFCFSTKTSKTEASVCDSNVFNDKICSFDYWNVLISTLVVGSKRSVLCRSVNKFKTKTSDIFSLLVGETVFHVDKSSTQTIRNFYPTEKGLKWRLIPLVACRHGDSSIHNVCYAEKKVTFDLKKPKKYIIYLKC